MKVMSQTRGLGEPPPKVWRLDQASIQEPLILMLSAALSRCEGVSVGSSQLSRGAAPGLKEIQARDVDRRSLGALRSRQ